MGTPRFAPRLAPFPEIDRKTVRVGSTGPFLYAPTEPYQEGGAVMQEAIQADGRIVTGNIVTSALTVTGSDDGTGGGSGNLVTDINKRFTDLEAKINQQLNELNGNLVALRNSLVTLDARVAALEKK